MVDTVDAIQFLGAHAGHTGTSSHVIINATAMEFEEFQGYSNHPKLSLFQVYENLSIYIYISRYPAQFHPLRILFLEHSGRAWSLVTLCEKRRQSDFKTQMSESLSVDVDFFYHPYLSIYSPYIYIYICIYIYMYSYTIIYHIISR